MGQVAQGWCTGMTLRDGIGSEMGGGFRIGDTCTPMADSCQCVAKTLQYCNLPPIKINELILKNKETRAAKENPLIAEKR